MTEFTPADLVRTAKYCGHEVEILGDVAWMRRSRNGDDRWGDRWNPREDASQRDELVEALLKSFRIRIRMSVNLSGVTLVELELREKSEDILIPPRFIEKSQGDAVFRAALEVIP